MVELIITLLIGSLLLAWGMPNYRDLKVIRLVVDNSNEVNYSLALARAEAVRYGRTVSVIPEGGDWNDGWLISTTGIAGEGNIEIYRQDELNDQLIITQLGALQGALQFNSLGELNGLNEGLFRLSHITDTTQQRLIRIKPTGYSKVETP